MQAYGRYMLIECVSEDNQPQVSELGLCVFLARKLLPDAPLKSVEAMAYRIMAMIRTYEKGAR